MLVKGVTVQSRVWYMYITASLPSYTATNVNVICGTVRSTTGYAGYLYSTYAIGYHLTSFGGHAVTTGTVGTRYWFQYPM